MVRGSGAEGAGGTEGAEEAEGAEGDREKNLSCNMRVVRSCSVRVAQTSCSLGVKSERDVCVTQNLNRIFSCVMPLVQQAWK